MKKKTICHCAMLTLTSVVILSCSFQILCAETPNVQQLKPQFESKALSKDGIQFLKVSLIKVNKEILGLYQTKPEMIKNGWDLVCSAELFIAHFNLS